MPQFNFATYSSQIFWILICFGIFYTYIRFFFIPKLENILSKRNAEIKLTQEIIEQNNANAQENLRNAQENVQKTHELANKIISDAQEKARIAQEDAIKEMQAAQRNAIHEIMERQKAEFSAEFIQNTVVECAEIVLKKIGMEVNKQEIEELASNLKK